MTLKLLKIVELTGT